MDSIMVENNIDYQKPELLDFSRQATEGTISCFIDCTSDELCPGSDELDDDV